ncbi:MAG: MarR family transcriptional regulator, organic hydroperoxide resistance regulator [Actinomycetota bacterium]|nr:MarR family transcriptional regulator, organic hydroperoxide resistance regulator [Actinomycetota bacterium]
MRTPAEQPRGQGGFLLSQVHYLSRRVLGQRLRAHGIEEFNPGQGRIIFALWQGDGVTITELARRTSLERSTLTRMLDRMEKDGLVRREQQIKDRRSVDIWLTPRTREMFRAFANASNDMREVFYRDFSDEEIGLFEMTLDRILANLTATLDNTGGQPGRK